MEDNNPPLKPVADITDASSLKSSTQIATEAQPMPLQPVSEPHTPTEIPTGSTGVSGKSRVRALLGRAARTLIAVASFLVSVLWLVALWIHIVLKLLFLQGLQFLQKIRWPRSSLWRIRGLFQLKTLHIKLIGQSSKTTSFLKK